MRGLIGDTLEDEESSIETCSFYVDGFQTLIPRWRGFRSRGCLPNRIFILTQKLTKLLTVLSRTGLNINKKTAKWLRVTWLKRALPQAWESCQDLLCFSLRVHATNPIKYIYIYITELSFFFLYYILHSDRAA